MANFMLRGTLLAGLLSLGTAEAQLEPKTLYEHGRFTEIRSRDGNPVGVIYGITEDVKHKIFVEARRPPFVLFQVEDGWRWK